MQLLVVQHDHASPLGPVAERFVDRGWDLTVHSVVPEEAFLTPGVQSDFPEFTDFDAVVPMGAPWSTYDASIRSWVRPESDQIRAADQAGVPILGICFGGQLLASALGGTVRGSAAPEIGWTEVRSDDESIVPGGPWFQWHYDRWELPTDAIEIARNAVASQAFIVRRNLGVQFHPELTTAMLMGWLGNGGNRKARAAGIDPDELLQTTTARQDESRLRAHRRVDGFLDHVATRHIERPVTH